jgi:hypothetical protein
MLNVVILSVVMLNVFILNVVMPNVVNANVVMQNVVMLSVTIVKVVMLGIVTPLRGLERSSLPSVFKFVSYELNRSRPLSSFQL